MRDWGVTVEDVQASKTVRSVVMVYLEKMAERVWAVERAQELWMRRR